MPAHFRFIPASRIAFASSSSVFAALWKQRARNSASARLAHALWLVCGVFMTALSQRSNRGFNRGLDESFLCSNKN